MPDDKLNSQLRQLPSVTEVLEQEPVRRTLEDQPRAWVVQSVQTALDDVRRELAAAKSDGSKDKPELLAQVVTRFEKLLKQRQTPGFRRVINATGVVIHTNLGRSLLAAEVADHVRRLATCYNNLEFDLAGGQRGSRYALVERELIGLCGAEAACVVNNNAAAVFLCLKILAEGREVIVSRGQLVEIGGSFRIPDIMAASGAKLVEVGTTNKTHLKDYRQAVTDRTALLLKVHTSNYRMVGFTQEVELERLVELGRELMLPVVEDLGSGCFLDTSKWTGVQEPTVQQALATGADVVTFSGDKMLGGPQAGIIAGKKKIVDRIKAHPLMRMVRVDKMTLAALETTLRLYADPEKAIKTVPTLTMLALSAKELDERAGRLAAKLTQAVGEEKITNLEIIDGQSQVGGGSLPLAVLPTRLIAIAPRTISVSRLAERLRSGDPPLICRIIDDRLVLDPRTLLPEDEDDIVRILNKELG